ncbi:MAG TPA: SUMF1/EgtB/PvdO family nonheme iron enzyme [Myxococcaceae bacterium]
MAGPPPTCRVFISSTFQDIKDLRPKVEAAVKRAGMTPVGMEWFTADDRPTVQMCVDRVKACDVFVCLVAHRFGWVPEGQAKGEEKSVTWLEYEAARDKKLPCLIFEIARNEKVDPSTAFDEEPGRAEKAKRLEKFKEQYRHEVTPAPFTEVNLEPLVLQALFQWKQGLGTGAAQDTAGHDEQVQRYRAELLAAHGTLHIAGFEKALRVPLDLAELYIRLRATIDLRGHGKAGFADARDVREQLEGDGRETSLMDAFTLATRLGRKGLVILGEPGSGKTTHLKRLLIGCLKEGSEKLGLPAGMLPVFLPLRNLEDPERETVDLFIERHFNEQLRLPGDFGARLLRRGNLLLLFDGLDEVAGAERREKVARWVERVLAAHSTCWPVVTCRFAGYGEQGRGEKEVRLSSAFLELHIQPLRDEQPEDFVGQWYRLVETGLDPDHAVAARRAEERAADLIATLRHRDRRTTRMAEMVGNPLLLASLCLVHRDHGRLPEDRWKLYQQCVEVLLERWRARPGLSMKVEDAKRVLQPVAEWLHREQGRARARAVDLEKVVAPELKAVRWQGGAKDLLAAVRDDAGLLTGWGPDQFGFMHLSFQEYLTACELRRRASEAGEKQAAVMAEVAGRYGESWWQEVLLLFVAMGNPSFFAPLMREVVKRQAFAEHGELLGLLLDEASAKEPGPFVELLRQTSVPDAGFWQRQRAALDALQRMGAKEELEALAGVLRSHPWPGIRERVGGLQLAPGKVGLTRKGGVEMVLVSGGEFWMGSPPEEEGRRPNETRHRVRVSPFWLGRYPVTNEQYGHFLKENPQVRRPDVWGDRKVNQPQQPVVGMTWAEAAEFTRWAGGRLPTEAEWEYACRAGTGGPRYDDLDAIAWYEKNSGGATHPVGQKRANAWGLYDMLGNAWEWVEDWYGEYPEKLTTDPHGPTTGEARVVRGGGWYDNDPSRMRGAIRYRLEPELSFLDVGFRCARGVEPP